MLRALFLCLFAAGCSGGKGSATTGDTDTTDTDDPTCVEPDCDTTDTDDPTGDDDDGDDDDDDDTTVTGASLLVTFSLAPNVAGNMNEDPEGPFIGEVFRSEDVGAFGPENGAVSLGNIEVSNVVLPTDGSATAVLFTLQPVPPLSIVILGFIDTDGNNNPNDPGPDADDPVTLPNENEFVLQPDVENTVEVHFGLLNPF